MKNILEAFAEEMTLGKYPERLAELLGRKLPGVRWLLRSIAVASKSEGAEQSSRGKRGEYWHS